MNRLEAIKAMLDGKKIGHPRLCKGQYYTIEDVYNPIRLKREDDIVNVRSYMVFEGEDYYIVLVEDLEGEV